MKFHLLSDIHLERLPGYPGLQAWLSTPGAADYLCLCGDIGDVFSDAYEALLAECALRYTTTFIIHGNHEAYGTSVTKVVHRLTALCEGSGGRLVFLNNSGYTLPNAPYRVVGTPLWSHVTGGQRYEINCFIADYRCIDNWTVQANNQAFQENLRFLKAEVQAAKESGVQLVVMTHHAPLLTCGHPRHKGSSLSSAFQSDLKGFILEHTRHIRAWLYGHDHHSMSQTVGETLVMSNQVGYPDEEAEGAANPCLELP